MEERREYFRILDMAFVKAKPYLSTQTSLPEYFPEFRKLNLFHELETLSASSQSLTSAQKEQTQLQYLDLINRKVDVLGKILTLDQLERIDIEPQQITISEGGIGFRQDKATSLDSYMALLLIFTPSYLTLFLKTRVVVCDRKDEGYLIRGEFEHANEESRQTLARHLLKQQAKNRDSALDSHW